MGTSAGVMMGASAMGNAYSQSSAYNTKAQYEMMEVADNQQLAAVEEQSAMKAGDVQADNAISRGNITSGKQLASYGAQGVDVHSGSAAAEVNQTQQMASIDAITARNNAWRKAWGIAETTLNTTGEGTMQALGDQANANNSLITGGTSAMADFTKAYAWNQQNSVNRGGGGGPTVSDEEVMSPTQDFTYNSGLWGPLDE